MDFEDSAGTARSEATSDIGADGERAPVAAVIALSSLLAFGLLLVVAPVLWLLVPITRLPPPFPNHHQDTETMIFVVAFAVLVPLGVLLATLISDRIAAGPNAPAQSALVALLAIGLALVVVVTKLATEFAWGGGPGALAAAAGLWCVVAAATLARAASSRLWSGAAAIARRSGWSWVVAGFLLGAVVVAFGHSGSISVAGVLIALALVALLLLLPEPLRLPSPSRGVGLAVDGALVVLILLAVPNLIVYVVDDRDLALQSQLIQFHQNFFLGPANQILAGDAMLVDVLSQYGVGSIYFLAGAYQLLPIGNGTLGLIEGGLSALMFVATFATLRIAGVSRLLAGATMAVAVTVLVYGLDYPLGALLQHGAIRFGLPVGVVLGAVAESRWARIATPARALQLLTVAVASIWALEAFAYTLLTVVAVAAFCVATRREGGRRRELGRWAVQIVGACLSAHLLLAAGTLATAGELPDWGWYINTLRAFLFGQLGDWTYDFSPFSPGIAVGALYMASASAISLLLVRRPDLLPRQRTILMAITGMTAWGIGLFSYIINRSADGIIPYVCLPAFGVVALWLALLHRADLGAVPAGRRAALTGALALSVVLVAASWTTAETRYPQSALAHVVPGGTPLSTAIDRLWDPPPLRPEAPAGERLLRQRMPGEERSIVLTSADLSVEILMRAGRGNAVPLGDPWEDSFVPGHHIAPLEEFVEGLHGGELMLLDAPGRTRSSMATAPSPGAIPSGAPG